MRKYELQNEFIKNKPDFISFSCELDGIHIEDMRYKISMTRGKLLKIVSNFKQAIEFIKPDNLEYLKKQGRI